MSDGVPEEARRLESFLGRWTVEGTFQADDGTAAIKGDWRFEPALDGWGVLGTIATNIEGLGEFEETGVLGFEESTKTVHMFSANKFAIRNHEGEWVDLDRLRVRWVGSGDSAAAVEEIEVHFAQPDHITAKVVESADGAVIATTELSLSRDEAG